MHFTLSKNRSFAALAGGLYSNVRILHFDHNPQREPTFVTNGSIVSPWQTAKDGLTPVGSGRATTSAMEQFSGYGTFRLNFHHFHRFELRFCEDTHVRGAAFSCLRLKLANMMLI